MDRLMQIKRQKSAFPTVSLQSLNSLKHSRSQNQDVARNQKKENIQRENEILLRNIMKIGMRNKSAYDYGNERLSISPKKQKNLVQRRTEEERIKTENLHLARRLIELESNRKTSVLMNNNLKDHDRIVKNMQKFRETSDHKIVLKSIDTNRKMIQKIKLPALERGRSLSNPRSIALINPTFSEQQTPIIIYSEANHNPRENKEDISRIVQGYGVVPE